jgi:hypothetical protein
MNTLKKQKRRQVIHGENLEKTAEDLLSQIKFVYNIRGVKDDDIMVTKIRTALINYSERLLDKDR